MLSLWKSNLHIEPEIQENSNLIPLTRMILSIFFPNPASFQLAPCSNLCRYFLDCTLTSIFCLICFPFWLLLCFQVCLCVFQVLNLICVLLATPSYLFNLPLLQSLPSEPSSCSNTFRTWEILFCFIFLCFFLLPPAVFCCCLLLPAPVPAHCTCLEVVNPERWARGQGVPFLLSTGECLVFWHDTLVSCHQCHRSA